MNQEVFWSNRYKDAGDEYLFGTEPNHFLASKAHLFTANQKALSLGDGEGRNSVWLAKNGLDVTAVEISPVAVSKARKLAEKHGVNLHLIQTDMLLHDWDAAALNNSFDWVIGIFIQFVGPAGRKIQFDTMKSLACHGGRILLHGYTPKQLEYKTGGPSSIENLYTRPMLLDAFSDWEVEEIIEYEDVISEGLGHNGQSALMSMIARKPSE
ncbi:MAG: class I SAM-dependent methyltransferase [Methylotenera sp.]|nr:class I SAM-dependent methyltransferase [Methylotenera sp.]